MIKRILWLAILILGASVFFACRSDNSTTEDFPAISVKRSDLNKFFRLDVLPQSGNTNENNSIIAIHIENLTNKVIVFPANKAISIYSHKDNEWVTVPNIVQYPQKNDVLAPTNDFPAGEVVSIVPSIDNMNSSQTIKVIIIGYFEGDQNNLIGADIDILLLP